MKKLTFAIIMILSSFSLVSADIGVKIGVSAQLGTMESSAKEQSRDTSAGAVAPGATQTTKLQEVLFASGSFFVEKDLAFLPIPVINRLSIGYDNMAHDLEMGTAENLIASKLGDKAGSDQTTNNIRNKVSATVDGFETLYATFAIKPWLYVKYGNVDIDVKTTENLDSGGSYDNANLSGNVMGAGIHSERENGLFFRAEYNVYDIDGVTLNNKGTSSQRSVTLNAIDGTTARISIGKSF
tara:strand:+ start:359 stop:1078 length:720 start_codon:yes stop_codon:yes gene_type:complete